MKRFILSVVCLGVLGISMVGARTHMGIDSNVCDLTEQTASKLWSVKCCSPMIETVKCDQGEKYISLSNGVLLRLRPIFYYMVGWDDTDDNEFHLFRKEFSSVVDMFLLPRDRSYPDHIEELAHEIDFVEGQPCQVLLPPSGYDKLFSKHLQKTYYREYEKIFNKKESLDQWSWTGSYQTIPLNFHDTSVNLGPLRVNIYEHPQNEVFFIDPLPNTTEMAHTKHAHLVEADLLEFRDTLKSIDLDGTIQFRDSEIYAQMRDDCEGRKVLQSFEVGDLISANYSEDGVYEIQNLSKNCNLIEVYLSDPGFSDLRNFKPVSRLSNEY